MKRSEMLINMQRAYGIRHVMVETGHLTLADFMDEMLAYMEQKGIQPPPVPAKTVRGENYPWGGGCTMRCDCNECNPNFPMNQWEKE
jgi:hypothetical protein